MNAAPYLRSVHKACPMPQGKKTVLAMPTCDFALSLVYSLFQINDHGL